MVVHKIVVQMTSSHMIIDLDLPRGSEIQSAGIRSNSNHGVVSIWYLNPEICPSVCYPPMNNVHKILIVGTGREIKLPDEYEIDEHISTFETPADEIFHVFTLKKEHMGN